MPCTDPWVVATEQVGNPWTALPELPNGPWTDAPELAEAVAYLPIPGVLCQVEFVLPHTGVILTSPSGTVQRRLGVDNDGVIVAELLSDYPITTDDLVFSQPGIGVVVQLPDASYGRMSVADDGALTAQGVTIVTDGWEPAYELLVGPLVADLLLTGLGLGVLCVTPDGAHSYRVRLDIDGTYISEQVT